MLERFIDDGAPSVIHAGKNKEVMGLHDAQDIFICLFSKVTEVAFFMNEGFRFFDQRPCTNEKGQYS